MSEGLPERAPDLYGGSVETPFVVFCDERGRPDRGRDLFLAIGGCRELAVCCVHPDFVPYWLREYASIVVIGRTRAECLEKLAWRLRQPPWICGLMPAGKFRRN